LLNYFNDLGIDPFRFKESCFFLSETVLHRSHPVPSKGRTRRHERGAGCDGRECACLTGGALADGEVVWSWHPWADAKLADDDLRATVTTRSWTPGRARSSVNTIAQGNVGVSASPVVDLLVCFFTFAHEAMRAARAPGIPCALHLSKAPIDAHLGQITSRECEVVPDRHCERRKARSPDERSDIRDSPPLTSVVPDKRAHASAIRDP